MANLNYYKNKIKRFTLTEWLIGINVIMFLLTQIIDLSLGYGLVRLGGKVNALIGQGEFWRLFTAMFLHSDWMHLIFNMMALYILGRDIERFFGRKKFFAIYLVGGLMGSAASYVFIENMSVGASGAIFALMGANLFLYKLNPLVYKRIYGSDILLLIGVNLIIGFLRPNIDMAGHIGGLIGGFLTASAVGLNYEKTFIRKRLLFQAVTALLLIGMIISGTLIQYKDADIYGEAASYKYTLGHIKSATRIVDRGISHYPSDENLKLFKIFLESESDH